MVAGLLVELGVDARGLELRARRERAGGEHVVEGLRIALEHVVVALVLGQRVLQVDEDRCAAGRVGGAAVPAAVEVADACRAAQDAEGLLEAVLVEVARHQHPRVGVGGEKPVHEGVDRLGLGGAADLAAVERRLDRAEQHAAAALRGEVVVDDRDGLTVEGEVGGERRARGVERAVDVVALVGVGRGGGVGDGAAVGRDRAQRVRDEPNAVGPVEIGRADVAAGLAAVGVVADERVVDEGVLRAGTAVRGAHRFDDLLERLRGRGDAAVRGAVVVLDLLEGDDVRAVEAAGDLLRHGREARGAVAGIEVLGVVARHQQVVGIARQGRALALQRVGGNGHSLARQHLVVAETVVDDAGQVAEHCARVHLRRREAEPVVDLDALRVEVAAHRVGVAEARLAADDQHAAAGSGAGGDVAAGPVARHRVDLAKAARRAGRARRAHRHAHPLQALIEGVARGEVFGRRGEAARAADPHGRRERHARVDHLHGWPGDLGDGQGTGYRPGRRELGNRADDLHEVAGHGRRRARREHEHAVRGRRIAVAGRVLDVEAVRGDTRDDAAGGHPLPGKRRGRTRALDRVDRREGRSIVVGNRAVGARAAEHGRAGDVGEVRQAQRQGLVALDPGVAVDRDAHRLARRPARGKAQAAGSRDVVAVGGGGRAVGGGEVDAERGRGVRTRHRERELPRARVALRDARIGHRQGRLYGRGCRLRRERDPTESRVGRRGGDARGAA
ncbi:hypothetical protein NBEOAGPD_5387 [Methylobacterium gregans]|uniref:Uncharacterized protein n=1 Tax=Methylobacterium gregans TaxID=374424 RepID=A0AA37MD64_9HYPH|nr:hypothetical protein NBEOAGPD_5387 [Methylobacterium gregans]